MRIEPPPGGVSVYDWQPELFATFNAYYGALWSDGVLDQPTKEVGRLRNARVVDCAICRNLRFAGAREEGLTEDHVERIDDDYAASDLPERYKLAIEYTDVLLRDPAALTDDLKARLAAELTPAEIVELTATVTTASAFSKAAVAWGPPEAIPVTVTPSPGRR